MLKAAAVYFLIVFGAGFALGMLRVPWLEPMVGARMAELIEAPFMLAAIVLAARWVRRRLGAALGPAALLGAGAIAAGAVLAADVGVGVGLRGMTPAAVFTGRDAVSGTVYYGLLVLFALMPWLVSRGAATHPGARP